MLTPRRSAHVLLFSMNVWQCTLFFTLLHVALAGFYSLDPHVYELTPSTFDKLVYKSNYTTIVEFYAPWCGYCKQLKPVYHKLARYIHGNAKYAVNVAAVDCDREINKPLCSQHRVQGYPSLMVFRPPKFQRGKVSSSKHVLETYTGARELAPMVDFLSLRIKNYVSKFHGFSDSLGEWLTADDGTQKAVIVLNLAKISPLARSLAIDFLEAMSLASVSWKEGLTLDVGGHPVEIPVSKDDTLPVLLAFDQESRTFVKYGGKKLSNMTKIQKFLIAKLGITPREGEFAKREKTLAKWRGTSVKDEL